METARPAFGPRAFRALALAAVALGVSAAPAVANTTVTTAPGTLTVVAGTGEEVQLKHVDVGATGYVEVITAEPQATLPSVGSVACSHLRPDLGLSDPNTITCPDGTIDVLNLTTNGGDNAPVIDVCFPTMNVNLGTAAVTSFLIPACASGTFNLTTGPGNDSISVQSPGSGNTANMAINGDLGAGDDHFFGSATNTGPITLHGNVGNDVLIGGGGDDHLYGDDGNDNLEGGPGNDTLDGGTGDDVFDTYAITAVDDPGADTYIGGPGNDKLDLSGHAAAVNVSLDDVANDGSPGEGDNVGSDIEQVIGTPYNDVLTGSSHDDILSGGSGNDVIHGGDGNDTVLGGSGNDQLFGDAGNDDVEGGAGDDVVDGGSGTDALFGDDQGCSLYVGCATGNDTIDAVDGQRDTVTCGLGADIANVDAIDVVATDPIGGCESVNVVATVGAGATPTPAPTPPGAGITPISSTLAPFTSVVTGKPSAAKGAAVTVDCTSACSITATLGISKTTAKQYGLGKKAESIGTAKATLLASGKTPITIKLTKTAKAKLGKAKKVTVTLTLAVKDASGKVTTTTTTVTLKR